MKQVSFSDFEYSNRKKKTKREEFLEIMDEIIPEKLLRVHLSALTQILTQVCAKACGHSGQRLAKSRTFH